MITYYIERLPGGRGQLHADLVEPGVGLVASWPVGSPARVESIQAAFPRATA